MSAFHTYLRASTREQHSRLDSHPLMRALMQPGLTAGMYVASLRGLGMALAECESAIESAQSTLRVCHPMPAPPYESRLPLLSADLAALGATPCGSALHGWQISSLPELAGALYVLEGSRLGGQMIAAQLNADPGGPWPCRFFESGGGASVQHWKHYLQWAEVAVRESCFGQASAMAVHVFGIFAGRLDESATEMQRRA